MRKCYLICVLLILSNLSFTQVFAQTTINDGYGDLVFVPEGEFPMGDNFDEGQPDEIPVHAVYLDAYYIGKYEVTNARYSQFLNEMGNQIENNRPWLTIASPYCLIDSAGNVYAPKPGKDDFPAVEMTWYGAKAYCEWLTTKTDQTYRLPTEAEWEKAARGDSTINAALGHQRRYPWGDDIDSSYANYHNSYDPFEIGDFPRVTPVGYYDGSVYNGFATNDNSSPYGAYDMAGNVMEWCYDYYAPEYYKSSPYSNPAGPSSESWHVLRGGGYYFNQPDGSKSAGRVFKFYPSLDDIGFRVAREASATPVKDDDVQKPETFRLNQNYPNPFNPSTTISFYLPKAVQATLKIYTTLGQEIAVLIDNELRSGDNSVTWNAANFPSGVYFYTLKAGEFVQTRQMILMK